MLKLLQAFKNTRMRYLALACLLGVPALGEANLFRLSGTNLWKTIPRSYQLVQHYPHDAVQSQIQTLSATPDNISKLAEQSSHYLYYIYHEVRKRGMPGEIALLPIIESAYNPFSISRAGAVGLWQIMPGTGSGFGLDIDWWYDGRRDTIASTQAALNYLTYLYNYFDGDWLLAIAAYHSGEGTVVRAREKNLSQNKAIDFWSLPLPLETKAYVPRLLALAAITARPNDYGINLPPIANKPYFKEINLAKPIELAKAAQLANIDLDQLFQLNPGYNQWATPLDGPHTLLLPVNKVRVFKTNIKNTPEIELINWNTHTVQKGETLNNIAKDYEIDVAVIREVNHMTASNNATHTHQLLLLPKNDYASSTASPISERRHFVITKASDVGPQKITHTIGPRDSYHSLEEQYNLPAHAIRFWNQLPANTPLPLEIGKKLVFWVESKDDLYLNAAYYTVKSGDTLSEIATRFNVSMTDLKDWNQSLANSKYLYPKQQLVIHKKGTVYYTVKTGDTLSAIANTFNVKINDLKKWNAFLANKKHLYPEQRLTIQLVDNVRYYTVKLGDTLSHISKRFNVKISDLKKWNEFLIVNKYLYPNQEILIYLT